MLTLDVPTLADVLGVPTDAEWQGASLLPLAHGAGVYPLISISSSYENSHAGRIGNWKIQLKAGAAPHVWNLAKDPEEHKDLFGSSHVATRMLLDPMWLYRNWNVEWKKSQWGNAATPSVIIDSLRDAEIVMLLDNCEHILGIIAGFAEALLQACPRIRILATSREPLRIPGEFRIPLPPLAVPDIADSVEAISISPDWSSSLIIAQVT